MRKETWVATVDGYYEVSSFGRVRRAKSGPSTWVGRIMKLGSDKKGYSTVGLRGKTVFVHKLVARAFIGPRPSGQQINHKDLDKKNNRYWNLEYRTGKGNVRHAVANGVWWGSAAASHARNRLNPRSVGEIRKLYATGRYTCKVLGEKFGAHEVTIFSVVDRRSWKNVA